MEVVGIDFGTTNVRISTWDPEDLNTPFPFTHKIGRGGDEVMPVVVALQRQSGGDISVAVGEDADLLEDGANTLVIRNIKRWALSDDDYVKWRLEVTDTGWPTWWNPELRTVEAWGEHFQSRDLIAAILKEAVGRAGLPERFEWRAGCPVQASYEYRTMLAEVLREIAGEGRMEWVVDEPVLFLAAAQRADSERRLHGQYLVYDLGGGSFDCALVEVRDNGEMVVYGADGDPLLGGSNIDQELKAKLGGAENLLRLAKEKVSPDSPSVPFGGSVDLKWGDVEAELKDGRFVPRSLMAMRDAYISGKSALQRFGESSGDGPGDIIMDKNDDTGEVRFVRQLGYDDMERDLDGVIMFGGPTRSPFFRESLARWFGEAKVMQARDLIGGVADPELTGVSMGACYFHQKEYFHEVPSRLPYQVTLENTVTGEKVGYKPHQHFVDTFQPAEQFASAWLSQGRDDPQRYELTIANPDEVVLERLDVDGFLEAGSRQPATGLRLVIDRLGPVYVEKRSEGVGLPWTKRFTLVENPPWQTEEQRERLEELRQRQRQRAAGRRQQSADTMDQMYEHPEP